MAVTLSKRPVLQTNYGSHRRIDRVFWFDTGRGTAGVQFADGECAEVQADELEALSPDTRRFLPLADVLRERALVVAG
jgi:hypothetical protein